MMNRKSGILILLALTALAAGCGEVGYRQNDTGTTALGQGGASAPFTGTGATTGTSTAAATPGSTTTTSTSPSLRYNFILKGNQMVGTAMSYTINTDSVLKVTLRGAPPVAPVFTNMATNGFTGAYNCEQITVSALGQSVTKLVTHLGYDIPQGYGPCGGAVQAVTIDFSDRLGQGHLPVNVIVSNAMTDNCRLANAPNSGGCIVTKLYETPTAYYRAAGSLEITTHN